MPAGQPRVFPTPVDMDIAITKYMEFCVKEDRVPFMKGFCLRLGKCSDLLEFYKEQKEYSRSIKRLKDYCEQHLAENALNNKINPTMSIFLLKNNHNMRDRQDIEQNIKAEVSVKDMRANIVKDIEDSQD